MDSAEEKCGKRIGHKNFEHLEYCTHAHNAHRTLLVSDVENNENDCRWEQYIGNSVIVNIIKLMCIRK